MSCGNPSKEKNTKNNDLESQTAQYEYTNDLIHESSPYLLQHAHNPVHWKPWDDRSMELARRENRLIVLSIGYSSCHWCHVMRQESFEDVEVATLMNSAFVNIKVDREERPDVDQVYQTALELVSGSGGWPLNVIMLPDGKPVYLGTYHEKKDWMDVLEKFSTEYENNPNQLVAYADMLTQGIQDFYKQPSGKQARLDAETILKSGMEHWSESWDSLWGGELGEQKFVNPPRMNMLLDYGLLSKNSDALAYAELTLKKVALGGIYDHIGGGFFRYSTDPNWKTPHFEKMLYDNAQMISLFSRAYQIFGDELYKEVVYQTFDYLKRDMNHPKGGYYGSMDADSEGKEGGYYVWQSDELESVLQEDFPLYAEYYDMSGENHGQTDLLPSAKFTQAEFAHKEDLKEGVFQERVRQWNQNLLEQRKNKVLPHVDEKIITSWNALLIDGLVQAYKIFDDKVFLLEAQRVFDFLIDHNVKDDRLVHYFKEGVQRSDVFLEDYVFLSKSALSLYEVTLDISYYDRAKQYLAEALRLFSDDSGMFRYHTSEELIAKVITLHDGVIPSSNAVMAELLFKLGHMAYEQGYIEKSEEMIAKVTEVMDERIEHYGTWVRLLLHDVYPNLEIVVVGDNASSLIAKIDNYPLPNTFLIGSTAESQLSIFQGRFVDKETYIYVCQNKTCRLPVKGVDGFLEQMAAFNYPLWELSGPRL